MKLKFRNITATPAGPVSSWGVEGMAAALERGGLVHLQRVVRQAVADPYGDVALDLDDAAAAVASPLAGLAAEILERARGGPRAEVAHRVRLAVAQSGLTARQFAARLGTSQSRLSTYASGKVVPSAALLVAIERLARGGGRSGAAGAPLSRARGADRANSPPPGR
ncbi:MAG: helix-turn-helix domain-containing protein [Bifidobacteriaceae bacterium]|nr:helix-turn-helix domain-containing protein [Bifidobacteriaceae bacterium]